MSTKIISAADAVVLTAECLKNYPDDTINDVLGDLHLDVQHNANIGYRHAGASLRPIHEAVVYNKDAITKLAATLTGLGYSVSISRDLMSVSVSW